MQFPTVTCIPKKFELETLSINTAGLWSCRIQCPAKAQLEVRSARFNRMRRNRVLRIDANNEQTDRQSSFID